MDSALTRARAKAGKSSAARMAMMAMTTSNSMSVKASRIALWRRVFVLSVDAACLIGCYSTQCTGKRIYAFGAVVVKLTVEVSLLKEWRQPPGGVTPYE